MILINSEIFLFFGRHVLFIILCTSSMFWINKKDLSYKKQMWTLQNNIIWTFNKMSISNYYRAAVLNPGPPDFKTNASFINLTFLLWK